MAQSTYVFIYLPAQVHPTVAGRFDWEPGVTPHVGEFVYAASYLANDAAVPLDPIALPLREQVFTTTLSSGFFGVFRDAIPDDWGRHVALKFHGNAIQTDFDYLWLPTADKIGALAFGRSPDTPIDECPLLEWDQLKQSALLGAVQNIDRDVPLTAAEEEAALAFGAGTSAGGARPKLSVRRSENIWLAKLNRQSDRFNVVRVECAMLDLAQTCGITVPEHAIERIQGQDILLVKRFDRVITREGIMRHRMVSAGTVFQADEGAAKYSDTGSYPRLARELSRWTVTGDQDRLELLRRIAFNSLASVTDDHERNHALIAQNTHFRLSPAFDLVPHPGNTQRRYLALPIGNFGALAARQNILSSADAFGLSAGAVNETIDEIQNVVRVQWRQSCKDCGVEEADISRIEPCFDPPFFESELPLNAVM